MDIFYSDNPWRPTYMFKSITSMIWTDRYSSHGDFEIETNDARIMSLNPNGQGFILSGFSDSAMMVENVEMIENSEGGFTYRVSGRSVEAQLMNVEKHFPPSSVKFTNKGIYTTVGAAVMSLISPVYSNTVTPTYRWPNTSHGGVTNGPTVDQFMIPDGNVYENIKKLCDFVNMGFKFRVIDGNLKFYTYFGTDRSNPANSDYMLFSPDMDNFASVQTLSSIQNYKNVAHVVGDKYDVTVYAPGTPSNVSGFARREIYVDATDVGKDRTQAEAYKDEDLLKMLGYMELFKLQNRNLNVIQGDVALPKSVRFQYGLGDIVQVKDHLGNTNKCIITEDIYAFDKASGTMRRYPTFTQIS